MGLRLDAVMARIGAAWEGLKATIFTLLDDTVTGVVRFGEYVTFIARAIGR